MSNLIANRIRTPDGTILQSFHRHDFNSYTQADGTTYFVDGGLAYQRIGGSTMPIDASVYEGAPHEVAREVFHWGTRGILGDQPVKFKPLKDLDTDHIEAILDTQHQVPQYLRNLFEAELVCRGFSFNTVD